MDIRERLSNGEASIESAGDVHRIVCCDCGLVHDIIASYDPQKRMVALIFARRDAETKKARRSLKRKKMGLWSEE